MRRLKLTLAGVAIALAMTAPPASANEANGLVGACNMLNPAALPHMKEAMMAHTASQGSAGMFRAVDRSGCS